MDDLIKFEALVEAVSRNGLTVPSEWKFKSFRIIWNTSRPAKPMYIWWSNRKDYEITEWPTKGIGNANRFQNQVSCIKSEILEEQRVAKLKAEPVSTIKHLKTCLLIAEKNHLLTEELIRKFNHGINACDKLNKLMSQ